MQLSFIALLSALLAVSSAVPVAQLPGRPDGEDSTLPALTLSAPEYVYPGKRRSVNDGVEPAAASSVEKIVTVPVATPPNEVFETEEDKVAYGRLVGLIPTDAGDGKA